MSKKKIEEISLRGRIAYAIMCIEAYLKNEYPNKNWMILSQKMWEATNSSFEEWFFSFKEFIPEFVFEFQNYEASDFEYISNNDYYYLQIKNITEMILCQGFFLKNFTAVRFSA